MFINLMFYNIFNSLAKLFHLFFSNIINSEHAFKHKTALLNTEFYEMNALTQNYFISKV